ncbi:endolytic transglycosylase MltG [Coralloluteibacterium stylophorae]|uniref:Endolytic murein transglycosylase n=1 Tax=Coralloluteibacterium stylophorae TaxID=1776034 RepID=A0A8J8AYP7_9GAMM|nr:endolytic transglycosylase MltG [Coralloluteibacterium stylophorae]
MLFAVLIGVALAGVLWLGYRGFADAPLLPQDAAPGSVVIERGDGFGTVLANLRGEGVTAGHPLQWKALAFETGARGRIKAGEYALDPGLSPRELLQRMAAGTVIQRRFTIVEGWNIRQLRAALARVEMLGQRSDGMSDAELMAALGHEGEHPEGRFLPETYSWVRGDSDLDLLRRAYDAMTATLDTLWAERADDTPVDSPYEALILASIIEKETAVAAERPQIAGVFARRLERGMLLQTDPTVIYGVGEAYDGVILRSHLDTDTPYNTYTRAGLPPTPIAMPGRAAIAAALDPADGDALYFVARGDGSHVFSATLREHNRAVACYRRGGCE